MRDFRLPPLSRWSLRSSGLCTQQVPVIPYRRFGTTYRSDIQGPRTLTSPSMFDVKQQTGNKSLYRIRKAIGLYCSLLWYRSTTAAKFYTEKRQS